MNNRWMKLGFALAGALCLLAVLSTQLARGSSLKYPNPLPDVNGLFYGDGDSQDYYFLYASTSENAKIYQRTDQSTLYLAVVVSRTFNDNVFSPTLGSYLSSVGWSQDHTFNSLAQSDKMTISVACGDHNWRWAQDYVRPENGQWISDPYSDDGPLADGQVLSQSTPLTTVLMASASSLQWNLNNSSWAPTATLTRTSGNKVFYDEGWSPNVGEYGDTVTDELYYPDGVFTGAEDTPQEPWWEWHMVYEMELDVSVCGTDPILIWPVAAHNSPSKQGGENTPFTPTLLVEFGDLPEQSGVFSYPTTIAADGARHIYVISEPTYLGSIIDVETDGQPSVDATGDDAYDGTDDEDGIALDERYIWHLPGSTVYFTATVTGDSGRLVGWFDWNEDGDLDDPDEQEDFGAMVSGTNRISLTLPTTITQQHTLYARFRLYDTRLYTDTQFYPYGEATGGEVEDYRYQLASLGNYVWEDDGDDLQGGALDTGFADVTVRLYDDEGNLRDTTQTDENGYYLFTGLAPGGYYVEFEAPSGWDFVTQDVGSDDSVDSDADVNTGQTAVVTLTWGEYNDTLDAGLKKSGDPTAVTLSSFAVASGTEPLRALGLALAVVLTAAGLVWGIRFEKLSPGGSR